MRLGSPRSIGLLTGMIGAASAGCCDCSFREDWESRQCTVPGPRGEPVVPVDATFRTWTTMEPWLETAEAVEVESAVTEAPYGWDLSPIVPPEPGAYVLQPMGTSIELDVLAVAPVPAAPAPDEITHQDYNGSVLACCGDFPFHVIQVEWFDPPDGIAGWEVEVAGDDTFTDSVRALSPFAAQVCVEDGAFFGGVCVPFRPAGGREVWIRVRPIGASGDLGEWLDPIEERFQRI